MLNDGVRGVMQLDLGVRAIAGTGIHARCHRQHPLTILDFDNFVTTKRPAQLIPPRNVVAVELLKHANDAQD